MVAQSVERGSFKPTVAGSRPARSTKIPKKIKAANEGDPVGDALRATGSTDAELAPPQKMAVEKTAVRVVDRDQQPPLVRPLDEVMRRALMASTKKVGVMVPVDEAGNPVCPVCAARAIKDQERREKQVAANRRWREKRRKA